LRVDGAARLRADFHPLKPDQKNQAQKTNTKNQPKPGRIA